jgi:hypothetical protein
MCIWERRWVMRTVEAAQAAVLTPLELRRSSLLQRVRDDGGVVAEIMLATNWSDWVVRRDLLA